MKYTRLFVSLKDYLEVLIRIVKNDSLWNVRQALIARVLVDYLPKWIYVQIDRFDCVHKVQVL
jgi:hypothetical protein